MKKIIKIISVLVSLLLAVALVFCLAFGVMGYQRYQLAIEEKPLQEAVLEITTNSSYVPYEEISPYFVQALVSVEDRRFFQRKGIDVIAFGRALLTNFFSGEIVEGGSTIGQQVAKNIYFTHSPSLTRKVAEIFLLYDLERNYTQEEIFAIYANIIYYGDGYNGIASASRGYFNKEPGELTLAEASLLAGLPQSPAIYQLSSGSDKAIRRQQTVLQAMIDCGYIDAEKKQSALQWSQDTYLQP